MSNTIDKIRVNGTDYDVGGVTSWNDLEDRPFLEVEITVDFESGNTTSNKTREEILENYNAGKSISAKLYYVMGEMKVLTGVSFGLDVKQDEVYFYFANGTSREDLNCVAVTINTVKMINDVIHMTMGDNFFTSIYVTNAGGLFLQSSTAGSAKMFRISVYDDGKLEAEEI